MPIDAPPLFRAPAYFARSYFGGAGPVPPPRPIAASLDAVLLQVAAGIAGAGLGTPPDRVITPTRAFVSLDPEPWASAGGPIAALRPGRFAARDGTQVGTGRFAQIKDGSFTVTVADRCLLDQGGHDLDRLLAPADGDRSANLLDLAHQIEDLLTGTFVEDAVGNLLSVEPMFFREQSDPRRYSRDDAWAAVDLTFSLSYIPPLKV